MDKKKKYGIYKTIMIIAIAVFITFMITSISLYTYFSRNPITVSSSSKNTISNKIEKYRKE